MDSSRNWLDSRRSEPNRTRKARYAQRRHCTGGIRCRSYHANSPRSLGEAIGAGAAVLSEEADVVRRVLGRLASIGIAAEERADIVGPARQHTASAGLSDPTQARNRPNALRYVSNCVRVIGSPCPGTACETAWPTPRRALLAIRAGHAVSKNGAGSVTRSPITATPVAASYEPEVGVGHRIRRNPKRERPTGEGDRARPRRRQRLVAATPTTPSSPGRAPSLPVWWPTPSDRAAARARRRRCASRNPPGASARSTARGRVEPSRPG